MTTTLQAIRSRVTDPAVGGRCWIHGLVLRGKHNVPISGCHVEISWEAPDAFGRMAGKIEGPYPVSVVAEDPEFAELVGEINVAALTTIEQHEATIAAQAATIDALTEERDQLQQQLRAAQAMIIQLDQQRAALALQVQQMTQGASE